MTNVAAKDLRAVLEVIYALNGGGDGGEMPRQILAQLGRLVGCNSVSYNRADHTSGRLLGVIAEPADTDLRGLPGFDAVIGQHPGFAAYRAGQLAMGTSAALSDLADLPTLRRLAVYTDFHRPHGIKDQLLCVVQSGTQQATALAFNRDRLGFSHRDQAVADLATPHLAQAVARRHYVASLTAAVRSLSDRADRVEQALPRLPALTAREREVVEHLLGGATDREIARSLAISQRTVQKHLERVYRKVGLGNRASLIAFIHQGSGG